jgi:hypothetical protein
MADIHDIISRSEAKTRGLKRYFTGNPCPHGHTVERLVSNGLCAKCLSIRAAKLINAQRAAMPIDELRSKRAKEKRDWRKRDPERAKITDAHNRTKLDPQKRTKIMRDWRTRNAEAIRIYKNTYNKDRYAADPNYRLAVLIRNRLNEALFGHRKNGSAVRDLGCTLDEFRVYIEARFAPGMSWANHGEWHLDHVRELALFDLTEREQLLQACHYTNYQPLWEADNLAKRVTLGRGKRSATNTIVK